MTARPAAWNNRRSRRVRIAGSKPAIGVIRGSARTVARSTRAFSRGVMSAAMSDEHRVLSLPSIPGLYRIDDLNSDAFYIGSAACLAKRWSDHRYRLARGTHSNPRLQSIFDKDPLRLRFVVLESWLQRSKAERVASEQELLDASSGFGRDRLNINHYAHSPLGVRRSTATIEKLRQINTGRITSVETRAKQRAAKVGRPLSAEHRRKIGLASVGRPGPKCSASQLAIYRRYSDEQVRCLRRDVARGVSLRFSALCAGINRTTARRIIGGRSYKEVAL